MMPRPLRATPTPLEGICPIWPYGDKLRIRSIIQFILYRKSRLRPQTTNQGNITIKRRKIWKPYSNPTVLPSIVRQNLVLGEAYVQHSIIKSCCRWWWGIHEHIPTYFLGNLSGRSSLIRPPWKFISIKHCSTSPNRLSSAHSSCFIYRLSNCSVKDASYSSSSLGWNVNRKIDLRTDHLSFFASLRSSSRNQVVRTL